MRRSRFVNRETVGETRATLRRVVVALVVLGVGVLGLCSLEPTTARQLTRPGHDPPPFAHTSGSLAGPNWKSQGSAELEVGLTHCQTATTERPACTRIGPGLDRNCVGIGPQVSELCPGPSSSSSTTAPDRLAIAGRFGLLRIRMPAFAGSYDFHGPHGTVGTVSH